MKKLLEFLKNPTPEKAAETKADMDALDIDHESTPAQWMVRDRPQVARHLVARGCRDIGIYDRTIRAYRATGLIP